jgi:single-strand DNA-binding protein
MNSVNLIGRLTRDPRLRRVGGENGRVVCQLRLAVSNGPDRPPLFIDVATFDGEAEACARHLAKGRQVAVTGRLTLSEWTAKDGSRRSEHSVIGRVEFLAGSRNGAKAQEREAVAA